MARSREQAQELISAGRVAVRGTVASKPATQVDDAVALELVGEGDPWVSRGAHKLLGALSAFDSVDVVGRRCLDAGASTGGFTQVLLESGAAHVVAADVGYGQLAWSLQTDERVTVMDRTNVRGLTPDDLPYAPDVIVADLSFISLEVVLPALTRVSAPGAQLLLMVKPQFEVGRADVGDGVIRDPDLRAGAVMQVARAASAGGLAVCGVAASPLPGPSGNVEYFLWLARPEAGMMCSTLAESAFRQEVDRAISEGPR
jgi:23S rRNA (cytidine1920-2'-O)/16S rRNA (cytidine1409-2'-O)-methyltransferase